RKQFGNGQGHRRHPRGDGEDEDGKTTPQQGGGQPRGQTPGGQGGGHRAHREDPHGQQVEVGQGGGVRGEPGGGVEDDDRQRGGHRLGRGEPQPHAQR